MTIFRLLKYTIFFVIIAIQFGWATTYYVDATYGNDSNSGTSTSSAWKSISKVNSISFKPGDQILFKRGETWTGSTGINIKYSGTVNNPITFGAYGTGNKPIIHITSGNSSGVELSYHNYSYITISNLHLIGDSVAMGIHLANTNGVTIDSCDVTGFNSGALGGAIINAIIKNCTFYNNYPQHGFYFSGGSKNIIVENNIFRNNNASGIHFNCDAYGNYIENVIVRYNKIYGNSFYGIQNTASKNCEFYYNEIYNNNGYGLQFEYDTHASGFNPDSNKVYNNVFYNNSGPSIYIGSGNYDNVIKNNILVQSEYSIYIVNDKNSGQSNIFSNNIYYGTSYTYLWLKNGALYSSYSQWASSSGDKSSIGGSQLQDNPLFNNASDSDFTVQNNSPAIGAGIDVGLTQDIIGNKVGNSPDIGVFQFIK